MGNTAKTNGLTREEALAVLRWYLDAGVDEAVEDVAIDRTVPAVVRPEALQVDSADRREERPTAPQATRSAEPAAEPEFRRPAEPRNAGLLGGREAVADAVERARVATSLDELEAALAGFEGCPLKRTATNLCFGRGSATARVVLIGEAPGQEEDRQGRPFVGASGQLLDRMLASIDLDESNVFITNTVFWRPPGNREPSDQETEACRPFLERIIELIAPDVLLTLGGPAAKVVLGQAVAVSRLRGRWFDYHSQGLPNPIPATATYHPAYLLRSPGQKRLAWRDLLGLKDRLAGR